jgi:hypothetical protein
VSKSGDNIKNTNLENALITLSAGKLSFQEILNVIISSNIVAGDRADVERECVSVYRMFDEDLSVIWRKV